MRNIVKQHIWKKIMPVRSGKHSRMQGQKPKLRQKLNIIQTWKPIKLGVVIAEMEKSLKEALHEIEEMGSDIIIKPKGIEFISSGFDSLDEVLSGGFPCGRIIELFGNESGGKTTLSLHAIVQAQKAVATCAFIDAEQSYSKDYAASVGVDNDRLILISPNYGEQALETVRILASSGSVKLIVVDSVANLVPQEEMEAPMEKMQMALQARMMAKGMRKLTGVLAKSNTCCIFINQLREKPGIAYGNPEVTPGGRALKFYSSVRLSVRSGERLKSNEEEYGYKVNVVCIKSKVGEAKKHAELVFINGAGFSKAYDRLIKGVQDGTIDKVGAFYTYKGKKYHGEKAILGVLE